MANKIAKSELDTVIDSMNQLKSGRSKLPGLQSLLAIDQQRIARGFTAADLEILTGALYLDAERLLLSIPVKQKSPREVSFAIRRAITPGDVKAVLSKRINTSRYTHANFARMLKDANAKLAAEPQYRRKLAAAQANASRHKCGFICIGMISVVVLGIILLILL